jgi:BirA family biotin operon repressor/biotin-[acetyl-CoA-carboxylase] ligase
LRVSDLSPASVEPLLRGRLGRPYRFVAVCESTQQLLGPSEREGATVAADLQTRGRGRLGRRWEAPAGRALLFSVLLRPSPPMSLWPELSLVAGEAVAAALPLPATVAAPNDVLAGGRKLAGILPEASDGRVVLGIGVNVNQRADELPAEAAKPPTSLRLETGRDWPRGPLLAAILLELERRYDRWQALHAAPR